MIFNGVVRTAVKEPRDGSPLVSVLGVGFPDDPVFLRREGTVLNFWRQLVAPPQPA